MLAWKEALKLHTVSPKSDGQIVIWYSTQTGATDENKRHKIDGLFTSKVKRIFSILKK